MARPPGNADTLMIKAGMELARKNGCSSLRIREVADRAGVNLGMFHYHFKNRKRFTRLLLEEIYGEFFHELTGVVGTTADPLKQLRESLTLLGRFLRKNRRIVLALFKDVLNGEPGVLQYARENTPPHVEVIQRLIRRCQAGRKLPPLPLSQIFPLLFGAIAAPVFLSEITEKCGRPAYFDSEAMMSDGALAERIGIVLRGLRGKKS